MLPAITPVCLALNFTINFTLLVYTIIKAIRVWLSQR